MSDTHNTVQYQLRLTETMRNRLKQSAKENERTLNAEIVARLENSYKQSKNDLDIFMSLLAKTLEGMPDNETSDMIATMVNTWRDQKESHYLIA